MYFFVICKFTNLNIFLPRVYFSTFLLFIFYLYYILYFKKLENISTNIGIKNSYSLIKKII